MKAGIALLTCALSVQAAEVILVSHPARDSEIAANLSQDQTDGNAQRCAGMYSRKAWGGAVDPFILIKFLKPTPKDGSEPPDITASLVVFEWQDRNLIGKVPNLDKPDEARNPP